MSTHLDQLRPLLDNKIPLVMFERELSEIDAVLLNNVHGGYTATQYLLELGHRRIACICGPDAKTRSHARIRGYEQALTAAGLEVDPELIQAGDWTCESGQKSARQLFDLPAPPTAIFACNDLMAIGALTLLRERGIKVPEEVSVIGFDNIGFSAFTSPPLTTLATPITEIGQRLSQLLLGRISGQLPPEPQRLMVEGRIVVRGSTAPVIH